MDHRDRLPPPDSTPVRLLALSGSAVASQPAAATDELLAAVSPDVVVATPPQPTLVSASVTPSGEHDRDCPVLVPERGVRARSVTLSHRGCAVITVPPGATNVDELTAAREQPADGESNTDGERSFSSGPSPDRICVTPQLTLAVDPYERSATIEGVGEYCASIPTAWQADGTVHCSTGLRTGFTRQVKRATGTVSVVGVGQADAALGVGVADTDPAAVVEVYPGGTVGVDTVSPDGFGLTGISGVGPKRAETLRRAGYQTPRDVAAAQPRELARLDRIGRSVAAAIHDAATARVDETVVATGDDSLPRGDPVFIDIETDGLEPSVAWLVGVLDGDAADGHYMPFTQPEPGSADHLEAFLSWADANARGRPLVAWNGWGFDFPVLEDQIRQRCPAYEETWTELYQFDPLWWATRKNGGNAALPGHDNTLETVAGALGWTPTTTGIDGQTVAEIYSAYRQAWLAAADPSRVQPPDWGRLEAYCEDDVRALATIYDALDAAARRDRGTTTTNRQRTAESTQGALSDFT